MDGPFVTSGDFSGAILISCSIPQALPMPDAKKAASSAWVRNLFKKFFFIKCSPKI
jgi:hypothetical protein